MSVTDSDASATNLAVETLYLAQIHVSYEQAIRLLKIRDTYDWHQRIWKAFPDCPDKSRDFLVRIDRKEEAFRILLLSASEPTRPDWCPTDSFESKPIPDAFFENKRFAFSLLANPTKKIRSNTAGERTKNGRRVPILDREGLLDWLKRKAFDGGFAIDTEHIQTIPRGREYFHKSSAHGTHSACEFKGELQVTDSSQFRATVAKGIGSAKAFGFGLLVLAPIHP